MGEEEALKWRLALVDSAERSLDLLSFLWYDDLGERGVRVRILTNSLTSKDVPAVTAKYKKYRKPLLDAGVELFELRAQPGIQPGVVDTNPVVAKFAWYHTKAVVVDREKVYIGPLNLDPRRKNRSPHRDRCRIAQREACDVPTLRKGRVGDAHGAADQVLCA